MWIRDLAPDEIKTEKQNVLVFEQSNEKPVINMLKYISEKREGDERTCFDKEKM